MAFLMDAIDSERAARLQHELGLKGWLVSWTETLSGEYEARISVKRYPRTIKSKGRTRVVAISKAIEVLTLILNIQSQRATCHAEAR